MGKLLAKSFLLTGLVAISPVNAAIAPESFFARRQTAISGKVPFIAQAPFGDWRDPRLQDGCEEAVITMAYYWASGRELTPGAGLKEIIGLADYQTAMDGEFRDRSVLDTARLLQDFFLFDRVRAVADAGIQEVIGELEAGNLVILPIDGQKVGNPHYRAPGPPNHMVLLTAYDGKAGEFIAHDPGTAHGEAYRYARSAIEDGWRDYPTGYHASYPEIKKNFAVVFR